MAKASTLLLCPPFLAQWRTNVTSTKARMAHRSTRILRVLVRDRVCKAVSPQRCLPDHGWVLSFQVTFRTSSVARKRSWSDASSGEHFSPTFDCRLTSCSQVYRLRHLLRFTERRDAGRWSSDQRPFRRNRVCTGPRLHLRARPALEAWSPRGNSAMGDYLGYFDHVLVGHTASLHLFGIDVGQYLLRSLLRRRK